MTSRVTAIAVLDSAVADAGDLPSTAFCTGAHHFPDQIERKRISGSSHTHVNRGVTA
jgi:hypothetical protein